MRDAACEAVYNGPLPCGSDSNGGGSFSISACRERMLSCQLLKATINMLIPAICVNPKCKTIWFTQHLIGDFGGTCTIRNVGLKPCPTCGGIGNIPEGQYSVTSSIIFNHAEMQQVSSALIRIMHEIAKGASPAQIRKTISSDTGLKKALGKFIPKDLKDLQSLFWLIGSLLAFMSLKQQSPPPEKIALPVPAIEVLETFDGQRTPKPVAPQHKDTQPIEQGQACETKQPVEDNR